MDHNFQQDPNNSGNLTHQLRKVKTMSPETTESFADTYRACQIFPHLPINPHKQIDLSSLYQLAFYSFTTRWIAVP
ncbi:hypothetical protein [Fluviicola sp.]|uniref:hypothetical protein n=1 Tax=Fluviicola sp. TaxID=1917219 RepID=UPI0031E03D96